MTHAHARDSVGSAPAEDELRGASHPTYSVVGEIASPLLLPFVDALAAALGRDGYVPARGEEPADLVIP